MASATTDVRRPRAAILNHQTGPVPIRCGGWAVNDWEKGNPSLRLDHVIIATNDPVRSAQQLADNIGLAAVEGGLHDGPGPANNIVPLGRGYLELVTVHDRKRSESNTFGRLVLAIQCDWFLACPQTSTGDLCLGFRSPRGVDRGAHRLHSPAGTSRDKSPVGHWNTSMFWAIWSPALQLLSCAFARPHYAFTRAVDLLKFRDVAR